MTEYVLPPHAAEVLYLFGFPHGADVGAGQEGLFWRTYKTHPKNDSVDDDRCRECGYAINTAIHTPPFDVITFRFFASCNDLFYWGTADCEEIDPADVPLLRQTLEDLRTVEDSSYSKNFYEYLLPELFACRKRGMRPQTPVGRDRQDGYKTDTWPPSLRSLFDAAGPPRDRKDEG